MIRAPLVGLLGVALAVSPLRLGAQSLASPFGTVSQKIDSTTMTVDYYRPSARGRVIFGSLVRWGAVWTPGANWATTLEIDHDVRIEGQPLPRGKYSMWMVPAAPPDSWSVIFNRAARRFHVTRPDPSEDQLRVRVVADSAPAFETLTFSFPLVSRTGATLALNWASTIVPMRIEIQTTRAVVAAAHPNSSYVGVYELREEREMATAPVRFQITEKSGQLWVHTTGNWVEEGLDPDFDLVPAGSGGDGFHPRQYKNGKLVGTELDELVVFRMEGNQAVGFEIRGIAEARVLARAVRARP